MLCWYTPTRLRGAALRFSNVTVFTAAVDKDTGPDNLTFTVSSSKKGHVALVSSPSTPVRHFKQAQINYRQVLFIHAGTRPYTNGGYRLLKLIKLLFNYIINFC